jgi:hypothetical protein
MHDVDSRFSMEPGWTWSECVKPVAGTDGDVRGVVDVADRERFANDDDGLLVNGGGRHQP